MFIGLSLACKYSALLYPLLGFLGIVWGYRVAEQSKPLAKDLALFFLFIMLFGAPFYLKNWIMAGNPLYPFMFGIFGGRDWDPELARLFDRLFTYMGMGRGWLDYLLLPWNVSINARMDSPLFGGYMGPLFLLVLPFLAGLRHRTDLATRVFLIFCTFNFLFWATTSQNIRYLAPLLALMSVTTGTILTAYLPKKSSFILLCGIIAGSMALNGLQISREFIKIRPFSVVFGSESREAFLSRSISVYPMYRFVNDHLPANAKIFLIYMKNYTYLCDRECYGDPMIEYYTLKKILGSAYSVEEVYGKLRGMGFSHIMYDLTYVAGEKSRLSPGETELFNAFRNRYLKLVKNDRTYYLYQLL
jgi:hypothetical protein